MSNLAGVPALLNGLQLIYSLITVNNPIDALNTQPLVYGVFDDNLNPVVTFDSCLAFDYHNESPITDAPLEKGAFISYNKVSTPYTTRLTVARGVSMADRTQLLDEIEKLLDDYNLYSIVTPERTYSNANIIGIDYRRNAEAGISMLAIDLMIREVRINQQSTYKSAKDPSAASQQSNGQGSPKWQDQLNPVQTGDNWQSQLNPQVS